MANWFDGVEATGVMEFPNGYFSVKDKIGDIMNVPQGEAFINEVIDIISSSMNMSISKGMMNMAKGFTVEGLFGMAGDRIPTDVILLVNKTLNGIAKP